MRDFTGDRTFLKLLFPNAAHGDEHAERQPVGFAEQANKSRVLLGETQSKQYVDGEIAKTRGLEALKRKMIVSLAPGFEGLPPCGCGRNRLARKPAEVVEIVGDERMRDQQGLEVLGEID